MRLAFDWGEARIGVAACDRDGVLAYPVETVAAGPQALARLVALVTEHDPTAVVVGFPRSLRGHAGPPAQRITAYATGFAEQVDVPVFLADERLTTVQASARLHAAGRSAKKQRSVIDQAAAVAILEAVLDGERQRGVTMGTLVSAIGAGHSGEEQA